MSFLFPLHPSETIGEISFQNSNYTIRDVIGEHIDPGDCVVLDIGTETNHVVWNGKKPLEISVLDGFGRLAMMNVDSGEFTYEFLDPGASKKVPPRTAYFYENYLSGIENLVLRDYVKGFDPADEPSVAEFFGISRE